MKDRRRDIIISGFKDKVTQEISIEIQDKKQLKEDGVDISVIYIVDFDCLKKLLMNDLNYFKKWLDINDLYAMCKHIDEEIKIAKAWVREFLIYEKIPLTPAERRYNEN